MTSSVADVAATVSATRFDVAEPPATTEEPCSRAVTSTIQMHDAITAVNTRDVKSRTL